MDQFLDPEPDPYRQFLDPETDVKCQFLDQKNLDPETVIMDQFLDPETDKKHQFLDPETDVFCQFLFWIQKLTLWISFWVQKLTLWARGTLWFFDPSTPSMRNKESPAKSKMAARGAQNGRLQRRPLVPILCTF